MVAKKSVEPKYAMEEAGDMASPRRARGNLSLEADGGGFMDAVMENFAGSKVLTRVINVEVVTVLLLLGCIVFTFS